MNTDDSSTKTASPVFESGQTVLSPGVADGVDQKVAPVAKNKGGRPKKADIEAKLKPGKRGRPQGDYQKARELAARMLVAGSDRMLQTLIRMALTEGHPNQMASLKMCLDRSLPISYFENKESGNGNGGQGITINITGVSTSTNIETTDDIIDVETKNGN
jgi:hypothetical protein